ncbi:Uncharacterised protein [Mycobacteroides abscessus subsp. abscessus]|nr:Uncharacterised protein [Mycobacteroides abscessus subsp. abscessus]
MSLPMRLAGPLEPPGLPEVVALLSRALLLSVLLASLPTLPPSAAGRITSSFWPRSV